MDKTLSSGDEGHGNVFATSNVIIREFGMINAVLAHVNIGQVK